LRASVCDRGFLRCIFALCLGRMGQFVKESAKNIVKGLTFIPFDVYLYYII